MKRQTFLIIVGIALLGANHLYAHSCAHPGQYVGHGSDPFIPRFDFDSFYAPGALTETVRDGAWETAATWSAGVPNSTKVARIKHNVSLNSQVEVLDVVIHSTGKLEFSRSVNTQLKVRTLQLICGTLDVGTVANPIPASIKAEIVIRNLPIDPKDPAQYGNGLIAMDAKISMHGAVKPRTFLRMGTEPLAGQSTLTLEEAPSGWQVGDRIVIPDSHFIRHSDHSPSNPYVPRIDLATIASISGNQVTLNAPLQFTHEGARDGDDQLVFLPHAGNMTRNVVIKSESSSGTRGHVMFMHRTDLDIRYTAFQGLGRTKNDPAPDQVQFDANGNPTSPLPPVNQRGRYALHAHHLIGPATTPSNGYQFTLIGNAVVCMMDPMLFRWGITIHNSHYGLVKDNVVYNWAGFGIGTEDGSESFNVIERNLVVKISGTGQREDMRGANNDFGHNGAAFWFVGPNNIIRDNVATNRNMYGYNIFNFGGTKHIPAFKGADPSTQFTAVNMNAIKLLEFSGNEVYGDARAMSIWHIGANDGYSVNPSVEESVIRNFKMWHIREFGIWFYPVYKITVDGLVAINYKPALSNLHEGASAFLLNDYLNKDIVIKNSNIQNFQHGLGAPVKLGHIPNTGTDYHDFTIENTLLRNYGNFGVSTPYAVAGPAQAHAPARIILRNVLFRQVNMPNHHGWPQYNIATAHMVCANNDCHSPAVNFIQKREIYVYNYNQVQGDDFRVYFREQEPNFIMPQSSGDDLGAPAAGLTNAQAWAQHGVALYGSVAPCSAQGANVCANAQNRPEIVGYAFAANLAPTMWITNPSNGSTAIGNTIQVRYEKAGSLSAGDHARLKLDNGAEVDDSDGDGSHTFSNVPYGTHTLSAYLVRANGTKINGTDTSIAFTNADNPTNAAPMVSAGIDQTVARGSLLTISGTAQDDGLPASPGRMTISWSGSGPGTVRFVSPSSFQTNVTFSRTGTYVLTLTAFDGERSGSDDMEVVVTGSNPSNAATFTPSNVFNPVKGESTLISNCDMNAIHIRGREGIVRELPAGASAWDGRNQDGEIVAVGKYMGQCGDQKFSVVVLK